MKSADHLSFLASGTTSGAGHLVGKRLCLVSFQRREPLVFNVPDLPEDYSSANVSQSPPEALVIYFAWMALATTFRGVML